uniref:Cdc23 domain-containing protein n=1 Tax=Plectus sambesii TaxID=2011161 RepID=A0A914W2E6_9BILA
MPPLSANVIQDLSWLETQCSIRRLTDAAKWASEMLYYLPGEVEGAQIEQPTKLSKAVRMARNCMDCQEFDRAAFFLARDPEQNNLTVFLRFYARYLAGEKKRLDSMADVTDKRQTFENGAVHELHRDLEALEERRGMDGFLYYLYGLVLLSQNLRAEAKAAFENSVNAHPAFWPAWLEIAKLVETRYELRELRLPDHWLRPFFTADVHQRLQMLTTAIEQYQSLIDAGFGDIPYIIGQMAAARHGLQDLDLALDGFNKVHEMDPYRIEQMDVYSNALYVQNMRVELAALAHYFYDVNKFCPETCCIVGNYYSLRGEHERAALYFQRALKLDPKCAGAWTLVGHEFMELKNTSAACLAYHHALEIDKKDFRGWYGLGQMYDILRMPAYALYYYQQAHKCRPDDSRMIVALGDMYSKQGRYAEAQKCFWKAHTVGDIERTALVRLGKLFEKEQDNDQAASCYMKYLKQIEKQGQGMEDVNNQYNCYRFLAKYCLDKDKYDEAHHFAQLCLDYDSTKEDGKTFLKKVTLARNKPPSSTNAADGDQMQVDGGVPL